MVVGALEPLAPVNNMARAAHRKSVAGSLIGSIAETQEVLDFCAQHGIGPDIEVIAMQTINDAYRDIEKVKSRYRYVIDMASLKQEMGAAVGEACSTQFPRSRRRRFVCHHLRRRRGAGAL